jgi:hypothetical protein
MCVYSRIVSLGTARVAGGVGWSLGGRVGLTDTIHTVGMICDRPHCNVRGGGCGGGGGGGAAVPTGGGTPHNVFTVTGWGR